MVILAFSVFSDLENHGVQLAFDPSNRPELFGNV